MKARSLILLFVGALPLFAAEPPAVTRLKNLNSLPPAPFKPRDPKDPAVQRGTGVVRWREWGAEALEEATKKNKPILLFITPAWNHWGKVMERSTFTDLEVATRLNEEFIPIRINRDERPDIDIRLQTAVQALFGVRGWPLTVFLTPGGEPFYGGTYFPAEDDPALEKTGLRSVIQHVMQTWRQNREAIFKQAKAVDELLSQRQDPAALRGIPPADIAHRVTALMFEQLDKKAGGFLTHGTHEGAKFPTGPALELALLCYESSGDEKALEIVTKTLDGMLNGAIYDQIGGGFHRCTTDRWWRQPRFEKLLTVNAEMVSALAAGYRFSQSRHAAEATAGVWSNTLSVPRERPFIFSNGVPALDFFYGSQASGCDGLDEGDYYTWTSREIESILDDEQAATVKKTFGIEEAGDLPQTAPDRNVLFRAAPDRNVLLSRSRDRIPQNSFIKMHVARDRRRAPPLDKSIYVDGNAAMSEALLRLGWKDRGLFTLDALLKNTLLPDKDPATFTVAHVLNADGTCKGTLSLSQDMAALASACVTAYEITYKKEYLEKAEALLRELDRRYWDKAGGGFFDRDPREPVEAPFLKWPIKLYQDTSELNANGVGALASARLAMLTGKREHENRGEAIIAAFGNTLEKLGPYGARLCMAAELLRRDEAIKDAFRKKLQRKVTVELVDTPISEAINFINQLARVGVILDPQILADEPVKKTISIKAVDKPFVEVLDEVLKQAGLRWEIRGRVFITK
ncbi:MAG TPA: DUF255 domain-containing protein [Planctomycetota bacterium]|nr:DUF255 domain-containing protein [Planctomycetota bacterium]